MAKSQDRAAALHHALVTRLKLRHLSLIAALDRHRSVSRVAAELAVSQPSVTKALREVEDIFSTTLFERTGRGLIVTAAGESVLNLTRRWLAELNATTQELTSIEAGRLGRLRLGIAHGVPQALLSAALHQLLGGTSRVAVMTREGTTDELVAGLLARELDCAIGRSYDGEAPGLVQHALYEQEACLVTAATTARRLARKPMQLASLLQLDWIMPPANTPMRRTYNALFVAAGLQPPAPILEAVYGRSVAEVLEMEPNAIAILGKDVASDVVAAGGCAVLPLRLGLNLPPVSFFASDLLAHHPAIDALRATLVEAGKALARSRSASAGAANRANR
jgi:DNA-binding transcriptional LysR family regulator